MSQRTPGSSGRCAGDDWRTLESDLSEAFRAPDYHPPLLPRVAMELLALSRSPDLELRHALAVLEKDPLIAGRVLHAAQSPIYAAVAPLQSLHQAVVRLGIRRLTDLLLEVCLRLRVFRAPGFDHAMEDLRRHSTATAHLARAACSFTGVYDEYAFLCGLLHDVGMAGALILIADRRPSRAEPAMTFEQVWPAVREIHPRASSWLCGHWQLPEEVRLVVGAHHDFGAAGAPNPLTATVALAEALVTAEGWGVRDEVQEDQLGRAARALELSPLQLDELRGRARDVIGVVD